MESSTIHRVLQFSPLTFPCICRTWCLHRRDHKPVSLAANLRSASLLTTYPGPPPLYPCFCLYNSLSSTLIYTTSISKFIANSSKKFPTTSRSVPLYLPWVKTKAGTRAFSVAAPVWNSPPVNVKSEGNNYSFIPPTPKNLSLQCCLYPP